ncbi:hypothetical protein BDZ45DRAFT_740792 [Acephala macrosclerotiorum]|nr:hypothetical protein BDZ45DRAFT_740792 [Acephala macrosclerotiorum]
MKIQGRRQVQLLFLPQFPLVEPFVVGQRCIPLFGTMSIEHQNRPKAAILSTLLQLRRKLLAFPTLAIYQPPLNLLQLRIPPRSVFHLSSTFRGTNTRPRMSYIYNYSCFDGLPRSNETRAGDASHGPS